MVLLGAGLRACVKPGVLLQSRWGVVWYCSGLGYVMSVMLEPQNSMVASVAIVLVLGGFFNGVEPRFRTLTPTMKTVFGAPSRPPYAGRAVLSSAR